jgi:hypothetical protein
MENESDFKDVMLTRAQLVTLATFLRGKLSSADMMRALTMIHGEDQDDDDDTDAMAGDAQLGRIQRELRRRQAVRQSNHAGDIAKRYPDVTHIKHL